MKFLQCIAMGALTMMTAAAVPPAAAQVDVEAGPVRVQIGDRGAAKSDAIHRADELLGMTVKNGKEDALGTVDNLVLDANGQVHFAIVSRGGLLGVGAKYHAVPWKSVTLRMDSDSEQFMFLDMSSDLFAKGPSFTSDAWPDFRSDIVCAEIRDFYQEARANDDAPTATEQ